MSSASLPSGGASRSGRSKPHLSGPRAGMTQAEYDLWCYDNYLTTTLPSASGIQPRRLPCGNDPINSEQIHYISIAMVWLKR